MIIAVAGCLLVPASFIFLHHLEEVRLLDCGLSVPSLRKAGSVFCPTTNRFILSELKSADVFCTAINPVRRDGAHFPQGSAPQLLALHLATTCRH